MVDHVFQEKASGGNINISESILTKRPNVSSSVKFKVGYTGTFSLDETAQYLDSSGNVLLEGKIKVAKEIVKEAATEKRIYEITIFDYGYNLVDGNVNAVYRNKTPEELIEEIVEDNGLTYSSELASSSGITIEKKVYRDFDPIEAVNELCKTIGASWRVEGTTFYIYRQGAGTSSISIDDSLDWVNRDGWKDDTEKKATQVIIQGADILQRTTETLTGTDTEFTTTWIPENVEIDGFTQTTETIDGDYTVDPQNKLITFEASQTDPVVSYSYKSRIRAQVGTDSSIIKVLKKSYIETFNEARKLGRKYLALYENGISQATFSNVDLYSLDLTELKCGDKISVTNSDNSARDGDYLISKVMRKYPKATEVVVGEDENAIYDWQAESKDRIKQLEAADNNSEYIQVDIPETGSLNVQIEATLTKLRRVENTGEILWASDTTLANDADLISDTGADSSVALAYDDDGLPEGSYVDYV